MTKDNSRKMPALFIGHGSPMNVISKNEFTDSLAALGKKLPEPRAILVISAHWLTSGTYVTCNEKPEMIYDFYGSLRNYMTSNIPARVRRAMPGI